jgi:6-phosphogluconolactonase (cycloisomerase 2 family)
VALLGVALLALPARGGVAAAQAADGPGAVYTLTNDRAGNQVLVWMRDMTGALTPAGSYLTGGTGSGDALGSQGALVLGDNGRFLFAVNAGSNDVSVFAIHPGGLALVDRVASGGSRPISVTVRHDLLYVLNAGDAGNIAGFRVGNDGRLSALPNSARPLSGNATGPAQVQFSPDGGVLVVTEKMTDLIDTYVVDASGLAAGPMTHASAGRTPFGFAFDQRGRFFVSEAAASALSSYSVGGNGGVMPLSSSVLNGQAAACWVMVSRNGRYAYTTNAQSGTISGYRIHEDGTVDLLTPDGRTGITGANPTDMALSMGGRYLYALTSATNAIWGFRLGDDGGLTPVPGAVNLPPGVVGLAAR